MNKNRGNTLFSLLLLLLFAFCSFFLLLVQIQGYQAMNTENERVHKMHTPIAYLSNKVRSFDEGSTMEVDTKGYLKIQKEATTLWIYEYQGSVYELYTIKNHPMHPEEGEKLFAVQAFDVEKNKNKIIFHLTMQGEEEKFVIGLRSGYEW